LKTPHISNGAFFMIIKTKLEPRERLLAWVVRFLIPLALLRGLLLILPSTIIPNNIEMISTLSLGICGAFLLFGILRLGRWPCPHCGKQFFQRENEMYVPGSPHDSCAHCGIALQAVRDAEARSISYGNQPQISFKRPNPTASSIRKYNRKTGFAIFITGIAGAILPWYLVSTTHFLLVGRTSVCIAMGIPFVFIGLFTFLKPPETSLPAPENKPRILKLFLFGLIGSAAEGYFFLKFIGYIQ
jgi:hypothetical protein